MSQPLHLLRAKQCASRMGHSVTTWWSWVREGRAPAGTKISPKETVWRSDEIEELIERLVPRQEVRNA